MSATDKTMPALAEFKVVWVDGYGRENVAERVVAEKLDRLDAEIICRRLRDESQWEGDWWVVQPQEYVLWRGMAEFV